MDPKLLNAFVEVVRRGSMADAAYHLGISGPAVSQQMARLESELSVKLLRRSNIGIEPTAAGQVLMERSIAILGEMTLLRSAVVEAGGSEHSELRVASFASGCVHLLPYAAKAISKQFPKLHLALSEEYDDVAPFGRLASGQFDIVLAHQYDHVPWQVASRVELVSLGRDPVDVLLSRDHPLANSRTVRLEQLSDEDWVLFSHDNIGTISIEREAADVGFTPQTVFQSSHYQTVIALVGANIGVTLLPRMITAELAHPACVARPLSGSTLGRAIYTARQGNDGNPVVDAFIKAVQERFVQLMKAGPATAIRKRRI